MTQSPNWQPKSDQQFEPMKYILALVAILALPASAIVLVTAPSSVQEIFAVGAFLVFVVASVGYCVIDRLDGLHKEAKEQTRALEQIARGSSVPAKESSVRYIPGINA